MIRGNVLIHALWVRIFETHSCTHDIELNATKFSPNSTMRTACVQRCVSNVRALVFIQIKYTKPPRHPPRTPSIRTYVGPHYMLYGVGYNYCDDEWHAFATCAAFQECPCLNTAPAPHACLDFMTFVISTLFSPAMMPCARGCNGLMPPPWPRASSPFRQPGARTCQADAGLACVDFARRCKSLKVLVHSRTTTIRLAHSHRASHAFHSTG